MWYALHATRLVLRITVCEKVGPIADRTSHIATSQQADQPCCQPFIAQYTATSGAIHTHQAKDSIVGT